MRVVLGKARAKRVLADVLSDGSRLIFVSQETFEIAFLPQPHTATSPINAARALLRHLRERFEIRSRCQSSDEQVHVVWHHAVGKNRELFDGCSTTELLQGACHNVSIDEGLETGVRAERQEIDRAADVAMSRKTRWSRHDVASQGNRRA